MRGLFKDKKNLVYGVIIIFIILIFIIGLILPNKEELPVPSPTPDVSQQGILDSNFSAPTGEKITASGKIVDNFFSQSVVNNRGDALITNNKDFQITYFSNEDQFLISVLGSPFESSRKLAENQFLTIIGIDKESACEMSVIITTPNFANPNEAGKHYNLSYCENE